MDTISRGNTLRQRQSTSLTLTLDEKKLLATAPSNGLPPTVTVAPPLPTLAALPLLSDDEEDKPVRQTKAMKLLGLEESDTSSNNAKQRASTIKERRSERLGIPVDALVRSLLFFFLFSSFLFF